VSFRLPWCLDGCSSSDPRRPPIPNTQDNGTAAKQALRNYWEAQACGTQWTASEKFSPAYFDEIERFRYTTEPFIEPFARFDRARGLTVLEVGVGAGTDFVQWARSGARAHGIDLTYEAVRHVRRRLAESGLDSADVTLGDCEALPYAAGTFDLVYSWGVIHHTPNTVRALAEIVRVCRPGGVCKLMVYHRHSLLALFLWVRWALLCGRPWMSFADVIAGHMESVGTKAYLKSELVDMLGRLPVTDVRIECHLTRNDRLDFIRQPTLRRIGAIVARVLGDRRGFFMTVELRREASVVSPSG
jgi:ubiquinone/menaquinone biosynthesis C-methylase UbiE